ncbi:MAG: YigZ family protein [Alphaproteobacteria bacterium]|nr:YigZ family protein [Alphaproteobacteria bacterium]
MAAPRRYQTLAAPVEHAIDPIKGSRFIGLAAPAADEAAVDALLEDARQRWPDARHHCWAWRLADGRTRSSDAGEPGGSAGRPILAQIEGHDLCDVVVVVVRWFGGVKLGVGGLIRAYGGCAGKTLDQGEVVTVVPRVRLRVVHDYDDTGAVQAVLGSRGLAPTDSEWGARATLTLAVPYDQVDGVLAELRDATSGRAVLQQEP